MAKLWKKSDAKIAPAVEKYTAGTDYIFDVEILPFDIQASRAHAKGLQKIGILNADELKQIGEGLDALEKDSKAGKIAIRPEDEDCHTVIENYLVEKIGEAGKKIHTGRSRNDQIAVAMRLYMKTHLASLEKDARTLARQFIDTAEKYEDVPMPGYSHTQQAMLTTVGHYFAAYAESLLDDADHIEQVAEHIDASPLGSAAGFGTSIPVDREFTAKEMGFGKVQLNTLYVQNSRGKVESRYLEALAQVMLSLGKFANDTLLFTSQEFDYFSVDESLTTGSSIMPHKKNLDPMEILRGQVSVVMGNQLIVKDIAKNLMSGYNRDGQLIKKPLIESTHIVEDSLEVAGLVLAGLTPKQENIRAKIHKGIFTADIANEMVTKEGMAFRDAYKKAAGMDAGDVDLKKNIASKKSLGAPGNLGLNILRRRLK
ncbi:argininosuccinate lyase [Candidatus Kaiserbacteria bacterium RIFCSPLOWO2_01_FULL_54_20]|uniref:Argininosuccinate lyase n=1 Tax=Candidatus Kaiserbacteria bacterium RIFCSPLOWO2_01_FULL_54_20 TaxID=1798513 RepID=A0A1F6EJ42_9BACT|nr:MAG: argininosuccinate lyase [Candidatus Kaiserbacteria bacterium RIFCSPLOWO2_01_FULL_54_20]